MNLGRSDTVEAWLAGSVSAGAMLKLGRVSRGFSRLQVANADGGWTWREVHDLETSRVLTRESVRRYLAALDRLGG